MTDNTEAPPPMGDNRPPLDPPDALPQRLARDHEALADEASDLELERLLLPAKADTAEQAAALTDFVAKAKRFAKRVDDTRTEEKKPYLDGTRAVDAFFGEITGPLVQKDGHIDRLIAQIDAFRRAEEARQAAERRAKEAEERRVAEEKRKEEQRLRDEAAALEAKAKEEEERLRKASTTEERAQAETAMRSAHQEAAQKREEATDTSKEAVAAERSAEAHGVLAERQPLARVTTSGASAGGTRFLNHRIKDADALTESLGPLGPFIGNDAIMQALGEAKRRARTEEAATALGIPGVEFFLDTRTNIRQARG